MIYDKVMDEAGGRVIITSPKPFVYVAGPISADPLAAVRTSMEAWHLLRWYDCWPFMPQWSVLPEMIEHIDYEQWLAYDFDFILRADALVRLPGESPGADREVRWARMHGLPIYHLNEGTLKRTLDDPGPNFATWVRNWTEEHAAAPSD